MCAWVGQGLTGSTAPPCLTQTSLRAGRPCVATDEWPRALAHPFVQGPIAVAHCGRLVVPASLARKAETGCEVDHTLGGCRRQRQELGRIL